MLLQTRLKDGQHLIVAGAQQGLKILRSRVLKSHGDCNALCCARTAESSGRKTAMAQQVVGINTSSCTGFLRVFRSASALSIARLQQIQVGQPMSTEAVAHVVHIVSRLMPAG